MEPNSEDLYEAHKLTGASISVKKERFWGLIKPTEIYNYTLDVALFKPGNTVQVLDLQKM